LAVSPGAGGTESVTESFQPPFGSREERIAYNEAWSRSLNERRAEWTGGHEARPSFRCECWQQDCTERIPLSGEDWKMVRAEPIRFAVAPDHVAKNLEAVVKEFPRFWVVEKVGEAGEVAEELASSDSRLTRGSE
jgi:hypothetical protein